MATKKKKKYNGTPYLYVIPDVIWEALQKHKKSEGVPYQFTINKALIHYLKITGK